MMDGYIFSQEYANILNIFFQQFYAMTRQVQASDNTCNNNSTKNFPDFSHFPISQTLDVFFFFLHVY